MVVLAVLAAWAGAISQSEGGGGGKTEWWSDSLDRGHAEGGIGFREGARGRERKKNFQSQTGN